MKNNNAPYIKITQKDISFFLLKLDIGILKESVNFHFREPYLGKNDYDNKEKVKANEYVEKLKSKGISIKSEAEGVQRRVGISRVNEIKRFVETSRESIFPSSIILSYNSFEEDPLIKQLENGEESGFLDVSKIIGNFTVIDGQHRLAGILTSDINETFELPISLFLNSSLSESTRIFRDINGHQKPVNKSFIYDLYGNITEDQHVIEAKLHRVCKIFNESETSPFYRQIKMLGTGKGAISQSFFIEYAKEALNKLSLKDLETQSIINMFFEYFSAVQSVHSEDWPVPMTYVNDEELKSYSEYVLRTEEKGGKGSKLSKTNGIGALFLMFPDLYRLKKEFGISYEESLKSLDVTNLNKIDGSGKSIQKKIAVETLKCISRTENIVGFNFILE